MANNSRGRCRPVRITTAPPLTSVASEPPVRRWPHPVEPAAVTRQGDPSLHYIRCALSYQNQLLAEIKTLLDQIVEEQSGAKQDETT